MLFYSIVVFLHEHKQFNWFARVYFKDSIETLLCVADGVYLKDTDNDASMHFVYLLGKEDRNNMIHIVTEFNFHLWSLVLSAM